MKKSTILLYQQRLQQYLDRIKTYENNLRQEEVLNKELLEVVKKEVLSTKTMIDNLYEETGVSYFEDQELDRQYQFPYLHPTDEWMEQLEHTMFMTDNAMKLLDKSLYLDDQNKTYNLIEPKNSVPVIEESEL